ncbi:MAG: type II toxin-antitoxin system VapC family toxin, partial [Albidovulum sp.]|uniref:PIN domain-containing protein n=1 Tax=Albidovulum sp. TaxID=1872424 RepID=UPI003CA1EE06
MFIDASAIVTILNRAPGSDETARRIEDHKGQRFVSPLVRFEAAAALARSRSGQHATAAPEQVEAAERI